MLEIIQFPCLEDNYGYLVRDRKTGTVAAIDTPDADTINLHLDRAGWKLSCILNTHHHPDHTGGNLALKNRWNCEITGPRKEAGRIPGIDHTAGDAETVAVGSCMARVTETPGHTSGHVIYHFGQADAAFVGDTLFVMGCGRLFEGTPAQMWRSLSCISSLPPDTKLYCAHEYTQANAAFALTVDPDNTALGSRAEQVDILRRKGIPTVPTTVRDELATNPFLRAEDPGIRKTLGMCDSDPVAVFAEIRARKDRFSL